ncbi:hypothetical protein SS1G_10695 [Sclerotinia sclerotiorum 1980 UF-70]|uniref:Uncharacterized protein n=1 Tax=Sclerotinia sclerotiorum (strain ATCC 18683 / 1980 / Ss-1) TaxID=665079 RepID=A7EZC8_SCLS1|nr:hypothetical protein SS1G_10695 [Sclerotinia sclerotiorum 1980 UF-70]EDN94820.1 hypothetical protein SS1G_10695 [Sclerotinia sclerotiorum 1980 UF-70]
MRLKTGITINIREAYRLKKYSCHGILLASFRGDFHDFGEGEEEPRRRGGSAVDRSFSWHP